MLTSLSVKGPSQQSVHPVSTVWDPEVVPQQMTHVVVDHHYNNNSLTAEPKILYWGYYTQPYNFYSTRCNK